MRESENIVRKNIGRIFWANGLTPKEGWMSLGFSSKPAYDWEISSGRREKIKEFFGATDEDLCSEDCLERLYGREYCFPVNINLLLVINGLSKSEFARELRISPTLLGYWQRHERKPSAKVIKRCEKYFGVPAAKLLFGYADITFTLEREDHEHGQMEKQEGTGITAAQGISLP
jgi:transcriptional regulator with XRE-family HTH domain